MDNRIDPRSRSRGDGRPARPAKLVACTLALVAGGLVAAKLPQEAVGEEIDAVRATIESLTETRRMISQEERRWRQDKEFLNDHINLVRKRMEDLQGSLKEAEADLATSDSNHAALVAEVAELDEAAAGLNEEIAGLEARVGELLAKLPTTLRDSLTNLSQKLPEDPEETEATLGARFLTVVGLLNQINKFQNDIHVEPETLEFGDGPKLQVNVMYLGISRAYFVDASGTKAGIGTGVDEGWVWDRRDEMAPAIQKAIAVYENTEQATYVGLPLEVQ